MLRIQRIRILYALPIRTLGSGSEFWIHRMKNYPNSAHEIIRLFFCKKLTLKLHLPFKDQERSLKLTLMFLRYAIRILFQIRNRMRLFKCSKFDYVPQILFFNWQNRLKNKIGTFRHSCFIKCL